MDQEKPNYFAIIPANVRYDKKLTAYERLLYGEITALSNKTGECWASNSYFANLYEVTPQAISKMIGNLAKRNHITVDLEYKNKQVIKRTIRLTGVSTYDLGVSTYDLEGYQRTIKENNINSNNNISSIVKEFENEIGFMTPFQLDKLQSYIDDLSEEMIIEAIHIASSNNKKNLSYIEAILKRWISEGVKCPGDIKEKKSNKKELEISTNYLKENGISSFDSLYDN